MKDVDIVITVTARSSGGLLAPTPTASVTIRAGDASEPELVELTESAERAAVSLVLALRPNGPARVPRDRPDTADGETAAPATT